MREIKRIYIHESDSRYGNVLLINWWHKLNGWFVKIQNYFRENNDESFIVNCGYNFIIGNGKSYSFREYLPFVDGSVEVARPENVIPAAVKYDNENSLHICIIKAPDEQPTKAQMESTIMACVYLLKKYNLPVDAILGHCEFWTKISPDKEKYLSKELSIPKTCPDLNMDDLREKIKIELELSK
jgi:N-acetylmuramoyl-L-alanine amidase